MTIGVSRVRAAIRRRMKNRTINTCFLLILVAPFALWEPFLHGRAIAHLQPQVESDSEVDWLRGKRLQQALREPISVNWNAEPLRDALEMVGRQLRVAVFLDRRVDPTQAIYFEAGNRTVIRMLDILAEQCECGIYQIGDVIYMGPISSVSELESRRKVLQTQLRGFSTKNRKQLSKRNPVSWPRLSQPKNLLQQLASEHLLSLNEVELPHDLWPQVQLPPVSQLDQLLLLTFGFGKTIRLTAAGDELAVHWDDEQPSEPRRYQVGLGVSRERRESLERAYPDKSFVFREKRFTVQEVTAVQAYEIHRFAAELGEPTESVEAAATPLDKKQVSLNAEEVMIGSVLHTIAGQLGVELKFEATLNETLRKRIDVSVDDETYRELLLKVLDGTGLGYELTPDALTILKK